MNTIIFTDGASRGNPGPGGWAAVILENDTVQEIGGHAEHTTNNRMELAAAIEALKATKNDSLDVYTDSKYLINGITKWIYGWQSNNWVTKSKEDVLNRDQWEELGSLAEGKTIKWHYVGGHVGIEGNERCDEIATSFADNEKISLYSGPVDSYKYNLTLTEANTELKAAKTKSKNRSSQPAYSYLSLLGGKLERHSTWAECEARVKGKSGVKFKKALSAADEEAIKAEWGVK